MRYGQTARQERANIRKAEYALLTTAQKLAKLDELLGQGVGAVKQRAKLAKQLAKEQVAAK